MSQAPDVLVAGTMTCTDTAAVVTSLPGGLRDVLFQVDPDSANDLYIGDASMQSIRLQPGEKFSWAMSSGNGLYVATSTGEALLRWLARR